MVSFPINISTCHFFAIQKTDQLNDSTLFKEKEIFVVFGMPKLTFDTVITYLLHWFC